jgi:hypothetical protein
MRNHKSKNPVAYGYEAIAATSKSRRKKAAMKCIDDTTRALMMSQGVPYDPIKKAAEAVVEGKE